MGKAAVSRLVRGLHPQAGAALNASWRTGGGELAVLECGMRVEDPGLRPAK